MSCLLLQTAESGKPTPKETKAAVDDDQTRVRLIFLKYFIGRSDFNVSNLIELQEKRGFAGGYGGSSGGGGGYGSGSGGGAGGYGVGYGGAAAIAQQAANQAKAAQNAQPAAAAQVRLLYSQLLFLY